MGHRWHFNVSIKYRYFLFWIHGRVERLGTLVLRFRDRICMYVLESSCKCSILFIRRTRMWYLTGMRLIVLSFHESSIYRRLEKSLESVPRVYSLPRLTCQAIASDFISTTSTSSASLYKVHIYEAPYGERERVKLSGVTLYITRYRGDSTDWKSRRASSVFISQHSFYYERKEKKKKFELVITRISGKN